MEDLIAWMEEHDGIEVTMCLHRGTWIVEVEYCCDGDILGGSFKAPSLEEALRLAMRGPRWD